MILHELGLNQLCSYSEFETSFPPAGLIVLVGPNGAGKSVLGVEALPWVLWGESVRGDDPVPEGEAWANVESDFGCSYIHRVRVGRRTTQLELNKAKNANETGQTPTETQEKISALFGDWRRFSATRVFSRALLSRFSGATDKERKALLERILGLEQFERAYKLISKKALESQRNKESHETWSQAATLAVSQARQALDAAGAPVNLTAAEERASKLKQKRDAARAQVLKIQEAEERAMRAREESNRRWNQWEVAWGNLCQLKNSIANKLRHPLAAEKGTCPVCLRGIAESDIERVKHHYQSELEAVERQMGEAPDGSLLRADRDETEATHADLVRQLKAARQEAEGVTEEHAAAVAILVQARAQGEERERLQATFDDRVEEQHRRQEEVVVWQEACRLNDLVAEVLGPRGARVALFSNALGRLEVAANGYLARGGPLRIALSSTKEQASGKVVDDVSIKILGAGGGRYSGASDGQRVRIDVALLLGLAEISGDSGLLVFDEVFDPLDDEGLEWISGILTEMAHERQIFITTHNPRFLGLLPAGSVLSISLDKDNISRVNSGQ